MMPQNRRTAVPVIRCRLQRNDNIISGLVMASPFAICFALFGIMNLIAGTFLIIMACKPRAKGSFANYSEEFIRAYNENIENLFDPFKIVGPILLITGSLLVIIGTVLGVVACKSSIHVARKEPPPSARPSCFQLSNINGTPDSKLQTSSNRKDHVFLCSPKHLGSGRFDTTLFVTDVHLSNYPCSSKTGAVTTTPSLEFKTVDNISSTTNS
ncbi:uncharacterized protein LOC143247378 [Tachypleus tridentatus]|uniref:uncharacterized protein LOC143247378 n=1 Tax=Tachypleus tridentatus TaxID=6853 RepID=UPI003FD2D32C